ncbi:MAG: hypothetical protein ABI251_06075 [Mycobacteriaceae bacterium]
MTVEADDLGRYFAQITERRRAEVAAAAEQIAQAKADEAVAVAEIEQQAHAAIATAAERAGDQGGAESGERGWPPEPRGPQHGFPAAFLPPDDTDDEETWRR